MHRILTALTGILLILSSCQKELSYELGQPARGSLQDNQSDCLPKNVNGSYIAGLALTDSNYVDVTVNVSQTGSYKIFTDTLNGYSFRGEGIFNTAGANIVRLKGFGTPQGAGNDIFTVFFDSSYCFLEVLVVAGGSSGGTAGYTVQGAGGDCTGFVLGGTFTQGTILDATNTVSLNVDVSSPGTWVISTPVVGGMSFTGGGTFTAAGPQTIVLTGSGTPATGTHTFPVSTGSSTCNFIVSVTGGNPPPAGVYFPLTQNSWWSYDDGGGSDSIKIQVSGTASYLNKTYETFVTSDDAGPIESFYYRKDNATGFYYTYWSIDWLNGIGLPITAGETGYDVLFMKDALTTGATWNSDHAATYQGTNITIRFNYTVQNANATLTVNGKTFTNVYHVREIWKAGIGSNFNDITEPLDYYYAKDIGLIKILDPSGSGYEQHIRNWLVN